MKLNTQKQAILALMLALALFTTGLSCGGASGGSKQPQVVLKFWKPYDSSAAWQPIISAYTQMRLNVRIEYTQKSPETYERDLLEAMAAGQGPDIYAIRNDWLPRFADKIRPATNEQINSRTFGESFVRVVTDDLVRGGVVYAVPSAIDVLALYFNRDLLASAGIARPPTTWDELLNVSERLTNRTGSSITRSGIAAGTSANVNRSADILQLLILQSGAQFYNTGMTSVTLSQGQPGANNEVPAARALRFYTQFADAGSRAYSWNASMPDSIDAFAQGRVAMIFGFSYLQSTISAKNSFLDYSVTGVPQLMASGTKTNLASYWAETVWNGSRNSNYAWDFIRFAATATQNREYVTKTGQLSPRIDVLTTQQGDPKLGVFADNVLSAKSVTKPEAQGFEKIMTETIDDVTIRGMRPADAINSAVQKLRLLLERYPVNIR